jgi:hypothetical protein
MSMAFEITEDDVQIVLDRLPIQIIKPLHQLLGMDTAEHVLNDLIDQGAVEAAALHGNDIDTQTNYALEEIKAQILTHVKNNLFKIHPVRKNPDGSYDECDPTDPDIHAWATYQRTPLLNHLRDWPSQTSAQTFIDGLWNNLAKEIL